MGDTRKIRKKYQKPNHPWNKERIDTERSYKKTYGLNTKKELWKAETILKGFKNQIKSFPSMSPEHAQKQKDLLRSRLLKLGLVKQDTPLGDVLGFDVEVILERRLQTIVFKKGLAKTPRQARQFINHEHILVDGRKINAPGYLVTKDEETKIVFSSNSTLFSESHPERATKEKAPKPKKKPQQTQEQEDVEVIEPEEDDE